MSQSHERLRKCPHALRLRAFMKGSHTKRYQYIPRNRRRELHCHLSAAATIDKVEEWGDVTAEENPRLAQTINKIFTIFPSQRVTRIHTPGPQQ
jgi:hypothetical protein